MIDEVDYSVVMWVSPEQFDTALRLMRQAEHLLSSTAEFSSLRQELKRKMRHVAEDLEFFIRTQPMAIDRAVFLAMEDIRLRHGNTLASEFVRAIEEYISRHNKKGNKHD